jgi:aspartate/methionine/tyrosine aminotransferase
MASNGSSNKCNKVPIPWSKKHKQLSKASTGGLSFSLSNSFAEPFTCKDLISWTLERQDNDGQSLVDEYYNHDLHYTPNGGSRDLLEEIAKLYGPNIAAEKNILVFPGAQVALQTAARAIVGNDASCHAITVTPCYQSVQEGPNQAGCGSTTKIQLKASNGWQLDMADVEAAIQDNTRYIVINEPFNPAGTLMSAGNQAALIRLARQHDIYVLCDEVYRFLEHDPAVRLPAMADAYEKGLSVVTLSKPWGACGVTIGWIASQDQELIREQLWNVQYFGCACPSRASELQAIMVLRNSRRILSRNMSIIRDNKKLLEQFMDDYSDLFSWVPPTAGAICAIHFHGPLSSAELGDQLAREAGISVKPAYCFTNDDDDVLLTKEDDFFRVGFGESIMPRALVALRTFVDTHKDEWRRAILENKE